jgi:multidrug efflux pump subunit AcrA (membrane-fusion protein)
VAVVGADDKVAFRNVKLGPTTGSDVVVAEGLAAGDRIVVEGLQKIRDGMVVAPVSPPPAPAAAPPPPATPAAGN